MVDFVAVTASNGPRINDPDAVERAIAGYYFDPKLKIGTAFDPDDGSPFLFLYGYIWPEAWEIPVGISRADFDPYGSDSYEDGADGFLELLREIAPYLHGPLTVQAIGHTKCHYPLAGCQWQIEPGSGDVTVTELGQARSAEAVIDDVPEEVLLRAA
jgi:hypothetical protein